MRQHQTNILPVASQRELNLDVQREFRVIPEDTIASQPDPLAAFNLQIQLAGFKDKKPLTLGLDRDDAQISRWCSGQQNPSLETHVRIARICGNAAGLQRAVWELGLGVVMKISEAEKLAIEYKRQLEEERLKNRVLLEAFGARK